MRNYHLNEKASKEINFTLTDQRKKYKGKYYFSDGLIYEVYYDNMFMFVFDFQNKLLLEIIEIFDNQQNLHLGNISFKNQKKL